MIHNVAVKDWKQIQQEFLNRKSNSLNHYVARRYMIRPARACKYKRTLSQSLVFFSHWGAPALEETVRANPASQPAERLVPAILLNGCWDREDWVL